MTSVEKVYRILELLRRHYRTGLTNKEISTRLGMPPSTCYRLMKHMKLFDFVSQRKVDKRFFLGFSHLRYADALVGGMDIPAVCLPHLERIHTQTKETTFLSLFSGQHSIVIELCGNINMLMSIARGEVMPMHCAASGKAILSFLPEPEQERILGSLDFHVFTEHTITDSAGLKAQLKEIYETGVAYNLREYYLETMALATPIFKRQNLVIGALAIVSNSKDIDDRQMARYAELLLAHSAAVTSDLGGEFPAWLEAKSLPVAGIVRRVAH